MTMMTVPHDESILRLHYDEQITDALHGCDKQFRATVYEHKQKLVPGFTTKYNISQLIYFEATHDIRAAIEREKQIKGWLRSKKVALIESVNPTWADLSARW
jgi:putative endonuclease